MSIWRKIRHNRRGVSAIEYALIAAGVLAVIGAGVALLGPRITDRFGAAADAVGPAPAQ